MLKKGADEAKFLAAASIGTVKNMNMRLLVAALATLVVARAAELERPKAGKVDILRLKDVKPGMQGVAWTVFSGTEPEPVPIEIIGTWKGQLGPQQDVILAKMGGKAKETNVAAGMSGSPVYIDGKLVGAVALRFSVFSPDAICGITPIERMLEIQDFDKSRPADARTPERGSGQRAASIEIPGEMLGRLVSAGADGSLPQHVPTLTEIDTPLVLSGFTTAAVDAFQPLFQQMGITAVQGGASAAELTAKPAAGWEHSLNPGDAVAGILVSGDMSATGMGTVTRASRRRAPSRQRRPRRAAGPSPASATRRCSPPSTPTSSDPRGPAKDTGRSGPGCVRSMACGCHANACCGSCASMACCRPIALARAPTRRTIGASSPRRRT